MRQESKSMSQGGFDDYQVFQDPNIPSPANPIWLESSVFEFCQTQKYPISPYHNVSHNSFNQKDSLTYCPSWTLNLRPYKDGLDYVLVREGFSK